MRQLIVLALLVSLTLAQITATMDAPPTIARGQQMVVRITVQNSGSETTVLVRQPVGYEPAYPQPIGVKIGDYITPQYYYWNGTIPAGGESTFEFAEVVTGTGNYQIPPATVFFADGSIETNSPTVSITCDLNGVCDVGESALICAADCPSGATDGFCDGISDGWCDADCAGLTDMGDPDCRCGNGVCDSGEDHSACPFDCEARSPATPNFSDLMQTLYLLGAGLFVLLILAVGAVLFILKRLKAKPASHKNQKSHK